LDWLFGYRPCTRNDPPPGGFTDTRAPENSVDGTAGVLAIVVGVVVTAD
jgi:hypothetical protein